LRFRLGFSQSLSEIGIVFRDITAVFTFAHSPKKFASAVGLGQPACSRNPDTHAADQDPSSPFLFHSLATEHNQPKESSGWQLSLWLR
jgi:hypothetical protein